MSNKFFDNFFRKDLNLNKRWWHRFLSIACVVIFIVVFFSNVVGMFDDAQLPRYTKIALLVERMEEDPVLIKNLINPGEKIGRHENQLYGLSEGRRYYDAWGGWLIEQDYYCSKNISVRIEEIATKTSVYHYKGNIDLVSAEDFRKYLIEQKTNCVEVLDLNNAKLYGNVKKALSLGLEADNMAIWKPSLIKSIFYVLSDVIFLAIVFSILLVIYYKIILYIVFGSKNKN